MRNRSVVMHLLAVLGLIVGITLLALPSEAQTRRTQHHHPHLHTALKELKEARHELKEARHDLAATGKRRCTPWITPSAKSRTRCITPRNNARRQSRTCQLS